MSTRDTELLPLDVAAREAFPSGGVTAKTLKLRARQGKLTVYRPGKAYLTTLADIREMISKCRVGQKGQGFGFAQPGTTQPASSPTNQLGLSLTELSNVALGAALDSLPKRKPR